MLSNRRQSRRYDALADAVSEPATLPLAVHIPLSALASRMNLSDYLAGQERVLVDRYHGDYTTLSFPAVYFTSWEDMYQQLELVNRSLADPLRLHRLGRRRSARLLQSRSGDFTQLWVTHGYSGYRKGTAELLHQIGVGTPVPPTLQVDHVVPRVQHVHPRAVTAVSIIRQDVNGSWGGGYERSTRRKATKIRGALTLIHVAKGLNVTGPSAIRSWSDIAHDLHDRGLRSMVYEGIRTPLDPREQLESELRLCANDPRAKFVISPGPRSEPYMYAHELKDLHENLPRLLECVLGDHQEAARRTAIASFLGPDAFVTGVKASHIVRFLLRYPLFRLHAVVAARGDVHSPDGAVGWLLVRSTSFGSQDRLAALGISNFDY